MFRRAIVFLLRWLVQWARLFDSLVGVLTLGIGYTNVNMWMMKRYLRYKYKD